MGGLKKYLPITFATFMIATLAIAGIPPFAGFFSKDEILWQAFSRGSVVLWLIGAIAALMTAFYMFRAVFLTFYGKERFDTHHHTPHEVDWKMWLPLVVLAFLSIAGGFLGMPAVFGTTNVFEHWLDPVLANGEHLSLMAGVEESTALEISLMVVSVVIALCGILLAWRFYKQRTTLAAQEAQLGPAYRAMHGKFYVDEIYDKAAIQPIYNLSNSFLYRVIDVRVIDGIVNGLARISDVSSGTIRRIQTGMTQNYAVMIVVGLFVVVGYLVMF
jgi:NADH-quinone oxidoreductase subunit L